MTENTKIKAIADYMRTHKYITSLDAINLFRHTRLSAAIYQLQHRHGYKIGSEWGESKGEYGNTRYKKYFILKLPEDTHEKNNYCSCNADFPCNSDK